jgi:GT2 family glycosyltransferase
VACTTFSVGDSIGWFRKGTEGAQDYDLFLRVVESIPEQNIFHIPKVLYHWRKIPGSTAVAYSEKSYAYKSSIKALTDYIKRNKLTAVVEPGLMLGTFRVKRKITGNPLVSIIIPFKDKVELLKKCVLSVLYSTDYKNVELILVSNNSVELVTFEFLREISKNHSNVTWHEDNRPFNFAQLNNSAVSKANGEHVLFLNNDTEVINPEWLSSMVEHIQRSEVGAVGAKLLFSNGLVQHAGVIMGLGGVAGHYQRLMDANSHGYVGRLDLVQNLSACTGACLLVKRNLFLEVDGFDEENLKVAFNDIDLCLKFRSKGFLVVYTPYALLYHYESISRGPDNTTENYPRFLGECEYMKKRWPEVIARDPYYNPNLTLEREDCGLNV